MIFTDKKSRLIHLEIVCLKYKQTWCGLVESHWYNFHQQGEILMSFVTYKVFFFKNKGEKKTGLMEQWQPTGLKYMLFSYITCMKWPPVFYQQIIQSRSRQDFKKDLHYTLAFYALKVM